MWTSIGDYLSIVGPGAVGSQVAYGPPDGCIVGAAVVDVMGISLPYAFALLMAAGVVVLGALALVARAQRSPEAAVEVEPVVRVELDELRAEARELASHAALAQEQAGRAAATAWKLRERASAAAAARDVAWQVQERASETYRQALREALAGRKPGDGVRDTGDERDREVARAALSAYRRGDISVEQLREVWLRSGDWDPRQDEREREAERAGIVERAARREFDHAAADARRAEQDAQIAEIAAHALADEAVQAAVEAHEVALALQAVAPRRRRWRRGSPGLAG